MEMKTNQRIARLDWLCKFLLDETGAAVRLPEKLEDKQRLFRALMNVREPRPIASEFLALQDAELQDQLREKGVVTIARDGVSVWQGDITRLQVDAIVNAGNAQLLGCFVPLHGCIDNAIHSAAGVQLRLACAELMKQHPIASTGCAKITLGYNLPARYVIHTVGPIVQNHHPTEQDAASLASCYRNCLAVADAEGLKSIAFCCISTGEYGYPNEAAAEIAIKTVADWFPTAKNLQKIVFNVFKDKDKTIYDRLLSTRATVG